jgi:hypothetical protein
VPTVVKQLHIAAGAKSTIWDYRRETNPNGGHINLRACVWHIPVIRNVEGRPDLDALRSILIAQGLMVQFGNDDEGNIALYTRPDRLCYHARGGNAVTCGVEQMHLTTGEPWSLKQLRASGWIANYLRREFGIPLRMADIDAGPGSTAVVARTGHTSHAQISRMAGYNDRSDPGRDFDYEYVFHAADWFARKGHFIGC